MESAQVSVRAGIPPSPMVRSALRPESDVPQAVTTPQNHRDDAMRTPFRIEPIDAVAIGVLIVTTAIVVYLSCRH
ncbi:hypothetical protein ACF1BP_04245 [Streptomyces sp. NPDC014735]|uniref:hypothetical protein n=1 Tax=unclassified Streptomyces TaxID=2593676 RepID=UPI0036FD6BC2